MSQDPVILRAAIVDDEELARQLIREYLWEAGGVEVVAECGNGFDAVKAIGELTPDLVFLDVQMPKLDGFEVLELIDPPPAVIFVTAYDRVRHARFRCSRGGLSAQAVSSGPAQESPGESPRPSRQTETSCLGTHCCGAPSRADARSRGGEGRHKVHIIPIGKLDYVEAQDDYIALHSEKKNYLKQQTISSIEAQLDPRRFVRIHRSYVVNLERIARIEPYTKDSRVAVLTDGTQLPVSRSGHARLKELLGENV